VDGEKENDGRAGSRAEAPAAREPLAGAQPSITAPANSIRIVRRGIDSLYLSYPGDVEPEFAAKLQTLKEFAQAPSDDDVSKSYRQIGEHLFTVLPRGRGRFPFVLEDNWFSIQVGTGASLPLLYVQVRSEYLTAVGAEEAIRTLDGIARAMGEVRGPATVSRLDLFADFVGEHTLPAEPGRAWLKRCRKRDIHEEADRVTGISFGAGNELSARLYDKTLEITKSGKEYMNALWALEGRQEDEDVWRMEFQTRRDALPEALKGAAYEALPHLGAWWRYLCGEWLRLVVPSDSDDTRTRWITNPVWKVIGEAWDVPPDAPPMTRVTKARAPSDHLLFKQGMWGLSSFMAREGIADLMEGAEAFLKAFRRYHDKIPASGGLAGYVGRKVRLKARRYNTKVLGRDDEG